jgi:sporulation protein YlmC with PRC-barrel domain
MAGAGVRLFTAGSVLTASQVNAYLMDQTIGRFADSAARDAAFGGLGEPSLSEGRVCYLDSDNRLYLYDGSAWVEIGAQIEDLEVTTAKINDLAVTTGKIADSAVTSAKIADGTIVNADISTTAAIELGKLADATIDIKTGNYTLQLTDKNKFIKMSVTSTANTVTIPTDASVSFPAGAQIHIIQYGSGKTQIIGPGVTIYSTPGAYLRAQYSAATLLKCAAANTWMLMGDLSAS